MRATVEKAWPAFCTSYEGRLGHMYLDTKKLVTTGIGNLIDTGTGEAPESALSLPWLTKATTPASRKAIAAEWTSIKGHGDMAKLGGSAFGKVSTLHLTNAAIDTLMMGKTREFWARLVAQLPDLDAWPADGQLALMDMAWHMGPNFLGEGWPNFTASAKAGDFTKMAANCPTANKTPRDARHQALFTNAAKVLALKLSPSTLWDTRTPVAPPPPPEETKVSPQFFRIGNTCACVAESLPWVEAYMIQRGLITDSIDIFQLGYRTDVSASAGTHAQGGAVDTAQWNVKQIDAWRVMGWTMQKRNLPGVVTHGHGWPLGCPHLSASAKAQARDWARGDDGLVGSGRVQGRYPIDNWKTSLERNKMSLSEAIKKAVDAAVDEKAIATKVLKIDGVIKNSFTDDPKNPHVALSSAIDILGRWGRANNDANAKLTKDVAALNAKVDKLVAALGKAA